jgi:hypothetical protein
MKISKKTKGIVFHMMSFEQDKEKRFSVHSTQPLGVGATGEGEIEVIINVVVVVVLSTSFFLNTNKLDSFLFFFIVLDFVGSAFTSR